MNSGPPLEEPALRAPPASLSELPADGVPPFVLPSHRPVALGGITMVIVALHPYLLHDVSSP